MNVTNYFRAFRKKDKNFRTYIVLSALRIILVFVPQIGYIHPDEFFQSVEVIAGDALDLEHTRTWEFNNTLPIRSIVIPYFLIKIPFNFLKFISMYSKYYLELDLLIPYMYLVYPRFIMCALSFLNDWSLYKICKTYNLHYEIRLMALASSFVMLTFGSRTFSNTIEMTLISVLLYFVADCMIHSNTIIYKTEFLHEKYKQACSVVERVKLYKLKAALPAHSFNRVLLMATLCVIGIFNRPTFLIFGAPIVFYWLLRGMGSKTITFYDFNLRIATFCICAIPAILVFVIVDSLYYLYLTPVEIQRLDIGIDNFVFTPWNFIMYNINSQNTAKHGVHPKYLHILVNIPLLYNILGITAICSFLLLTFRFLNADFNKLPRSQSIVALMTSSIFAPLFILSLINHQEARFLLPLTMPIILLHSPKFITGFCSSYPFKNNNSIFRFLYEHFLCSRVSAKFFLKTWFVINIFCTLFFGFLHQGGVLQLAGHLSNTINLRSNVHVHLVTSHIYDMPISFLNIPSSKTLHINMHTLQKYTRSKQFFLYEYGSTNLDDLYKKVKLILDISEMKAVNNKRKYKLYFALPSSLSESFSDVIEKHNSSVINFEQIKVFYPHLSTEALPKLFTRHHCDVHVEEDDLSGTCDAFDNFNVYSRLSISAILREVSSIAHQFGLVLYRVIVKKRTI